MTSPAANPQQPVKLTRRRRPLPWPILIAALALIIAAILYIRWARDFMSVVAERRERVASKLELLEQLGKEVSSAPPVPEDAPPIKLAEGDPLPNANRNTIAVHAEDLVDLTKPAPDASRICPKHPISDAALLVRQGFLPEQPPLPISGPREAALRLLTRVEELRYLLVLRTINREPPREVGSRRFEGGTFEGDVLVYDVEGPRYLGGFRVVTKLDFALVRKAPDGLSDEYISNVKSAFDRGLKSHVPGFVHKPGVVDPNWNPGDPCR